MRISIKICGLITEADIDAALGAGVEAIGLVLSRSPRRVAGRTLARLLDQIPVGVERIAVMDRPHPALRSILEQYAWDGVQLNPMFLGELEGYVLPPRSFVLPAYHDKAGLLSRLSLDRAGARAPHARQGHGLRGTFLLDGPGGGGRGQAANLERARRAALRGPMLLAGGLTPENVAHAIAHVRPFGVDVSSGVESSRGIKDPARIRAFVRAARSAAQDLSPTQAPCP